MKLRELFFAATLFNDVSIFLEVRTVLILFYLNIIYNILRSIHVTRTHLIGNTETPSEDPLRETYPRTAQPHRRPAKGDHEKSPPCWYYKRLQLSVPHHLITLRPTPSHREVWSPSWFFHKTPT